MTVVGLAPSKARAFLSLLRLSPLGLLAALLLAVGTSSAAEVGAKPSRLTVAVLTFEDQTGNPKAAHWRYLIERLLNEGLAEVKAVRIVPAKFGYRQLKLNRGGPITAEQARKLGELIEARRVVWGAYLQEGGKWLLTARVLNVAGGTAGNELKAAAADWYDVRDQLTQQVLKEIGIPPTKAEQQQMLRRGTASPSALEWYSKALAGQEEQEPLPKQEADIRKALEADPKFAEAYGALAAALGSQGQFEAAEQAGRQGVKLDPDGARQHQILGFVLMFQSKYAEAEKELREALRLDPDEAETLARLGECAQAQGNIDDAITWYEAARQADPTSAGIHARLGDAYARKRERNKALQELTAAERLDSENVTAEQMIWQGYATLHEIPLAVAHVEKFVTLARKQGLAPKLVDYVAECGRELKARLTPHEVAASEPTTYSPESLEATLRQRLTRAEYKLVVNPLASTPAMDRWAQELTHGATNNMDKARKLFDALARHLDTGAVSTRTAQQVFAAWNDPSQSFCCQEYAWLYIALARAVGLKAFYVRVERDYTGDIVYLDCAAVFIGGKALLVDPAYQWFGAPHKKYVVLDDVQAIAHYFFQAPVAGDEVRSCRLAAKLHPDSAWGQLQLAGALIRAGEFTEAGKALERAQRLDPDRWDYCTCRGFLAAKTGDLKGAAASLRKSLKMNPQHGPTHLILGWVLSRQHQLAAAREEYRLALVYDARLSGEEKAAALSAISEINESLQGQ